MGEMPSRSRPLRLESLLDLANVRSERGAAIHGGDTDRSIQPKRPQ